MRSTISYSMEQLHKSESLSSSVLGTNIYGIRTNSGERPFTCVTAKCCDANRIIEHVELNFDVNVIVDVSGRGRNDFQFCSRYKRKNRRGFSSENNTALPFSPTTLIIKTDFHILQLSFHPRCKLFDVNKRQWCEEYSFFFF